MRFSPLTLVVLAAAGWAASEYYKTSFPRPLSVTGTMTGQAYVSDGDSFRLNGHRIRLVGIDACEKNQPATHNGRQLDCGAWAREHMIELIGGATVHCDLHGKDQFGRDLATCFAGNLDLNKAMLTNGFAFLYRKTPPPPGYSAAERNARDAGRGIWQFEQVVEPYDYRKAQKAGA